MPVTPLRSPEKHIDVDKAVQRLAAIEALSILLSIAYSDNSIGEANPQIVGSAWDGIALLSADATKDLNGTL